MTAARSREVLAPELPGVEAVVCDADGVITDSAKVHAAMFRPRSPVQRQRAWNRRGPERPASRVA